MEYFDLIENRRSVRSYTAEPVKKKALEAILSAARLSPSACNGQPWRFNVLLDDSRRALAAKAAGIRPPVNRFAPECPVIIVVSGEKEPVIPSAATGLPVANRYAEIDVGSSIAYLTLAAADLGLGTCIMGLFDKDMAAEAASLPANEKPYLLIGLGHPADSPVKKQRLALEDTVRYL